MRRLIQPFAWACCLLTFAAPLLAEDKPVTLGVEAEDFQFHGSWQVSTNQPRYSGGGFLFAGGSGAELPAVTAVHLPRAGKYHLWVRSHDFPEYQPQTRKLAVSIHGKRSELTFGDSGQAGWTWEPGGAFDLPQGKILLGVHDVAKYWGRIDAMILTTDEKFTPNGTLGRSDQRRVDPVDLEYTEPEHPGFAGPYALKPLAERPVTIAGDEPAAAIENEFVRYQFMPAVCEDHQTFVPRVSIRRGDQWQIVDADPAAEVYMVTATQKADMRYREGMPTWAQSSQSHVQVTLGEVTMTTSPSHFRPEIWYAGDPYRFEPAAAEQVGDKVRVTFAPSPVGELIAEWSLAQGRRAARVKLTFTPIKAGEYGLGYHLFFRKGIERVEEIQLPMMWQRKRMPDKAYALLDPRTPTPLALAQTGTGEQAMSWAVIGDPSEIPYAWPDGRKPHMGLCIRDEAGNVQPSVYGPVPGTDASKRDAGQAMSFTFNVLVEPGDWYAGYRTAADEVFGLHDYRRNVNISLSDAALNMIDLVKDDEFGGWWRRAKGWYQIESHNTVTHAAPATLVSLYRLTGDEDLYRRRALPTMQYILSRDSVHFTPEPHDPGRYPTGPMGGPTTFYGSSTYSALAALTGGYTPAFTKIALPADGKVKATRGYTHAAEFNEWAARYNMTHDAADLRQAMALADEYLEKHVNTPPTRPVGYQPFWLLSFVPDWEGLLMMYELTGESRYLDGAAHGARQLMTGIWTQPNFPQGDTTIFPGGKYDGDPWHGHLLARGPFQQRLGFPLRDDSLTEHKTPAWVVSAIGLGFEQPSTLGNDGGRLIYQAVWAPEFLRLARYTGDKAFETYARNATVGRWANYPGYYVAGHMDLVNDPSYPYVGPDQSTIYYHHIVPHLSWVIDYLVADAELLSNGRITFPSLRENGYAYFDGKVFGHAPGKIFDAEDCWLWFTRGAAVVSNPQINLLAAHNASKFFAILANQDTREQTTSLSLSQQAIGFDPRKVKAITVRTNEGSQQVELKGGVAQLTLKPRQLVVVEVEDAHIDLAAHHMPTPGKQTPEAPTQVAMKVEGIEVKATAIATGPLIDSWNAYIWCTATEDQAGAVTFEINTDGRWRSHTDTEYPFEFDLPVHNPGAAVKFRVRWTTPAGATVTTDEATLGTVKPVQ